MSPARSPPPAARGTPASSPRSCSGATRRLTRHRHRRLHRPLHRRGRRRPDRARHRRFVPVRARLQPAALAPALRSRRRTPAARLTGGSMADLSERPMPRPIGPLLRAAGVAQDLPHARPYRPAGARPASTSRCATARSSRMLGKSGLGQIDVSAHPRRPDPGRARARRISRRPVRAGARHRDGVPELCAVSLADRARQRRARARGAGRFARPSGAGGRSTRST